MGSEVNQVVTPVQAIPVTATQVNVVPPQETKTEDILAIVSCVFAAINLCAWFIPLCGFPLTFIAIVLNIFGLKSSKYKTYATIALIISIIALVLTVINAAVGAYIGYTNPGAYGIK